MSAGPANEADRAHFDKLRMAGALRVLNEGCSGLGGMLRVIRNAAEALESPAVGDLVDAIDGAQAMAALLADRAGELIDPLSD